MLVISTWFWGDKYEPRDIEKLQAGLVRNLQQPFRFIVITDRVLEAGLYEHDDYGEMETYEIYQQDKYLLDEKGCLVRLRMFDPAWQDYIGLNRDDKLVCVDLDVVVTGPLDGVFEREEPFLILQGANTANPCPFNGSLMMLRPGHFSKVWREFSLEKLHRTKYYEFPDDQGWLHHMLPQAAGWRVGGPSGVYAFQKNGWPKGTDLPKDAKLVVFPGWRSPDKFADVPWVQKHWHA
jgi:hypothetical protein